MVPLPRPEGCYCVACMSGLVVSVCNHDNICTRLVSRTKYLLTWDRELPSGAPVLELCSGVPFFLCPFTLFFLLADLLSGSASIYLSFFLLSPVITLSYCRVAQVSCATLQFVVSSSSPSTTAPAIDWPTNARAKNGVAHMQQRKRRASTSRSSTLPMRSKRERKSFRV